MPFPVPCSDFLFSPFYLFRISWILMVPHCRIVHSYFVAITRCRRSVLVSAAAVKQVPVQGRGNRLINLRHHPHHLRVRHSLMLVDGHLLVCTPFLAAFPFPSKFADNFKRKLVRKSVGNTKRAIMLSTRYFLSLNFCSTKSACYKMPLCRVVITVLYCNVNNVVSIL